MGNRIASHNTKPPGQLPGGLGTTHDTSQGNLPSNTLNMNSNAYINNDAPHSSQSVSPPTQSLNTNAIPSNTSDSSTASLPMAARKACLDDFVVLQTVGKGSFGKVVMVRHKENDKIYAMKILKKEMVLKRKQFEHTLSERRILENIDHPYIVSLRFAFQTEHKLYMVFDFFNGGELYHCLSEGGRFGEERARFYAAEIVSALDYLHKRGIVYRDLKPENLLLDNSGHVRITDFGLSKEGVVGDSITSICGTPEYLSPEILRKQPYGVAVDWWSLGTLLFEMISGLPPFYDRNRTVMYRKILESPLVPPADMSPEAFDVCKKLLTREPSQRLGYRGAEEIKSHPFFASIDWAKLEKRELTPPWIPTVVGETDTRNIASEFTNEPALVTPSPMNSRLRDLTGTTPPSFTDFSFVQQSLLEGAAPPGTSTISSGNDIPQNENVMKFNTNGSNNATNEDLYDDNDSESRDSISGSDLESSSSNVDVMGKMEGLRL